jgi:hypothetical protein
MHPPGSGQRDAPSCAAGGAAGPAVPPARSAIRRRAAERADHRGSGAFTSALPGRRKRFLLPRCPPAVSQRPCVPGIPSSRPDDGIQGTPDCAEPGLYATLVARASRQAGTQIVQLWVATGAENRRTRAAPRWVGARSTRTSRGRSRPGMNGRRARFSGVHGSVQVRPRRP